MVPKKHRYTPKVKGCYECSQRRINCDRGRPQCNKCIVRGISCSGLGIRYRFHVNGVPSRNEFPDTERPHLASCIHSHYRQGLRPSTCYDKITVPFRHTEPYASETRREGAKAGDDQAVLPQDYPHPSTVCHSLGPTVNEADGNQPSECSLIPNPGLLAPETQFFFDHFSKNISSEMVIFDDGNNSWRNLMLPIGRLDNLVMNAILAASAFHLAANIHQKFIRPSNTFYTRAIIELKRRQEFQSCDKLSAQYTVLGLLILLAAVMVNGWRDFPHLFRMMEFALIIIGGEDKLAGDELGEFLSREIKKMRVYASPLIDQKQGALIVRSQAMQSFGCLRYSCGLHPEHSNAFSIVGDLIQQAYRIYLHRVSRPADNMISQQLVGHYRDTLLSLHPDSPGAHVLVWATYIVALESREPEHRSAFTEFLLYRHQRSGFYNITIALEHLRQIWSRSDTENWTCILPESRIFIM